MTDQSPWMRVQGFENVKRVLHRAGNTESIRMIQMGRFWPPPETPRRLSACSARYGAL
ncbi:MAG: hypothetical protein R2874_04580 [Desulfobacterales bacterium]